MRIVFISIYANGAQPSLSGRPITLIISNINSSLYVKQQRTHHTIFVLNINLSSRKFVKK
jgi:hypothetical protein